MDLNAIKLSLIRDKNTVGIDIINKIESLSKDYNISINKAITYCISNCKTPYEKRLLAICRSVYPYDGLVELRSLINCNPTSMSNINEIYYKVGKYTSSTDRVQHPEDSIVKAMPIGVSLERIFGTITRKRLNFEVQPLIIDISEIKTTEEKKLNKSKKKRKPRID